jgi:superfamily II DNA helicase RecQ
VPGSRPGRPTKSLSSTARYSDWLMAAESSERIDAGLHRALKEWRLQQSRVDQVPAYVIFANKTLDELCRVRPRTNPQLLAIAGIGRAKVDRYGRSILAVIKEALTA